ncbi:phosphoenolpyruvate--protein phosphotransferase [Limosilactobacillus fermentum]|uniref:phosphoenolpyruvate--protein phosphotransferase n=1 Tax=Limosilactobacillus fermentum TaxID=1613 RepID=UPI0005DA68B7|nr:phosphoenolpyruvate--protein phosphotransferase [Limosilactobacillus fermentum]MBD9349037.1 phosphoenolpyruvate--protein phosphotransferase [Limosilactobacillus fermentum]PHI33094.1 phosphoenolpyruvate--protein phosphotransferase [Limosilactobacillus fermentum]CDN26377.1 K08483 phosphotransferase system, enzyme I, PtsI [Limosilactobacillus fermentum]SJM43979.1 Phosphoenolpyruvate-protein phosphotransferase of PTS system [Limosilactobacillus fermentum]SJM46905.1 Phosphoenolpyruvate-protein p
MAKDVKGIAASDGIGIAPAYLLVDPDLSYDKVKVDDTAAEYARVEKAFQDSIEELTQIKENAKDRLGEEELGVFDAHIAILSDPEMLGQIKDDIENNHTGAEEAVDKVTTAFADMLAAMTDNAYMQERAADVKDVAKRAMSHLLGKQLPNIAGINSPVVIVAHEITPSDTSQMDAKFVKGIVTDLGGRTSHAAIMSRTLRIPAIVGSNEITTSVEHGQMVIVDGLNGDAIIDPSDDQVKEYEAKAEAFEAERAEWAKLVDAPSVSKDGKEFEIAANIGTPDDTEDAVKQGADGVGLFRSEFLYMDNDHMPSEDEQFEAYKKAVVGMNGKPVVVRTMDIGGDKPLDYMPLPKEENPFLGYRAIRICLDRPELFKTQLRALVRASEFGPVSIMFPMIATVAELRQAKAIFDEAKAEVQKDHPGLGDDVKIGMMIEIPLAALNAAQLAKEVDFFSIGTNDLIQYSFAADRGNEAVSYLYQPLNPAFLSLVKHVITSAHENGAKAAMCGEMAGDEMALPLLMGMGLDEYSMSATSILRTRSMMKKLDTKEWAGYVDEIIANCATVEEVQDFVKSKLG